jgi:hypothetical protein
LTPSFDWQPIATIAAPIIAFFLGLAWQRWLENRPVLISHYGHIAAFAVNQPGGNQFRIHTHAVVLRNVSRKAATNVRLHQCGVVPNFQIWQDLPHNVETLPGGSQDIMIPSLPPGRQIIISYLYFPPLTADQINAGLDCDQGSVRQIPVLLQRAYPRWIIYTTRVLSLIGVITIVYLAYLAVARFVL